MSVRSSILLKLWALLLPVWLIGCSDTDPNTRYIAVIDAGSSGSRIYLYERTVVNSVVQVRGLFDDQGGLPMSSFEASPADAGPLGVKPLIDKLTPVLAANNLSPQQVQVSLLATAGMRLVEDRSKPNADAIYASARNTLSASGMSVGRVETLTGTYEGVYSWVDVNYLRGNFREPTQALEGIIEVGGASAQVAYVSPNAAGANAVSVNVNGKGYRLFSISWLGLGQNEARGAMIDSNPANGGGTTNNACYPENPSAAGGLTDFNADINGKRITSGQYDFTKCNALYSTVLQPFNVGSASGNADFAGTRFMGVSSVYFALEDWGGLANPALVDDNLTATCTGPNSWGAVAARLGDTSKFKQNSCANGTYAHSLLFGDQGLKVDPAKLTSVSKADGQSFSWTRGFALIGQ
jgi:Golgi nucleoside diphosphatase